MHIMTTRNQRGHEWCGLMESYWDPKRKKACKRTIASLSRVPKPIIAAMKVALEQQRNPETRWVPLDAVKPGAARKHGAVSAVLRMIERLGLAELLAPQSTPQRDRVLAMLVERVLDPGSKLRVERELGIEGETTLGGLLGVAGASADSLYAALDWLADRQSDVEQALAQRHLRHGSLVLYDVSSSYFTGKKCPLAKFGYSRDRRRDQRQVVYGLLCATDGCPVAVSTFPGNTNDVTTVSALVARMRQEFGRHDVALVGDRGMLTQTRIEEDVAPAGLDWITAMRAPTLQRLVADGTLPPSLFDEHGLATVTSDHDPGERLIVCRNPIQGDRRRRTRAELLAKAEAHIRRCASPYARGRLGRDACNRRLGKLSQWKMQKHFHFTFPPDSRTLHWTRDEESIAREAATDGLYVVRTSLPESCLSAADTVRAYKDLRHVERAFQSLKSMLLIRPIRHYTEKRVRAHVFLCMLAYYVTWHLRTALRPMLFDDPAPATPPPPVAPRPRSVVARHRDSRRVGAHGLPLFPLPELLTRLGRLAATPIRVVTPQGTCEVLRLSDSTPLVQRAFELLGYQPHPLPGPTVHDLPLPAGK